MILSAMLHESFHTQQENVVKQITTDSTKKKKKDNSAENFIFFPCEFLYD